MTWSDLTQVIKESPNYSSREGRKIERITVHHTAGIGSAEGLLNIFANPSRQASANYVIGNDGTIGGCVAEEYRAWTSGSKENDTRAITLEVSNDVNGEPWSIGSRAWNSAVELCADICLRYGFTLWWDPDNKTGSITCHRWYQATACPGDWFYARIPDFIFEVNKKVNEILKRISALESKVATLEKKVSAVETKEKTDATNITNIKSDVTKLNSRVTSVETNEKTNAADIAALKKSVNSINAHIQPVYHTVDDCPDWAKPTVQKLYDRGDLKGVSKNDLGLNNDTTRVLVITDRAGGFDN